MKTYRAHASVGAGKYLGEVRAETAEGALEAAYELESCGVSVCHTCAEQIEDPEVTCIFVTAEGDESDTATDEPDHGRAKLAERLLSLIERGLSDGVDVRFAEFADGVHIWTRQDRSAWCSVGEGETLAEAVDNAERRDEL